MQIDPATNQLSRKERERRQREEEILQAARELFARKGYYNTTLEEIAHHAQFGKGTIYNYFSSKEDLFLGILNGLLDTNLQLAESSLATSGSLRQKLTAYAEAILTYSGKNTDLFQMVEREVAQWNLFEQSERMSNLRARLQKVWGVLSQPLAEEIKAGRLRNADAIHLAAVFDSLLRVHAMRPFRELFWRGSMDTSVIAAFIVDFFFDGVQQKGLNQ